MVLYNSTQIILFGGRDNEVHLPHVPKTYELINDEGRLEFVSYDKKPVRSSQTNEDESTCQPEITCVKLYNATSGNEESCTYSWAEEFDDDMSTNQREKVEESCGIISSGLYYNDVWSYDLSCFRYDDLPCVDDGWRVLHPGAKYGGCRNEESDAQDDQNNNVERVCDVPSERWEHSAAMIDESTMIVYGGYSQECEDYCDDLWAFDFNTLEWEKIVISSETSPGKRRKFSMLDINASSNVNDRRKGIVLYGGHRLWHGFSDENSQDNLWSSAEGYPEGGYLGDLWLLKKDQNNQGVDWVWEKLHPQENCKATPGITWESRNDITCEIIEPAKRSGHAAVFDKNRNGMWIHGGYSSHYPYPSSTSPGSTSGITSKRRKGFIPYASHSFYFNDLRFYNMSSGFWKEMQMGVFSLHF